MEKKLILDVHEKPKVAHWIALSIQHVLAMFGSTVLVPMLTGLPVSLALISSGIGTMFYLFVTKGKSPVYLGSSFAYIAPITSALALGATLNAQGEMISGANYGAVMGGLMMVGIVYLVIAIIIKFIGTDWLNKLLPPVVIGPTIMVIGLSLAGTAVNMASEHILIALVTLLTAVLVSAYTKGLLQLLPIFSGIVVGYLVAIISGVVDFSAVHQANFFEIPSFAFLHSTPVFNLEVASIMIPVAIVTITEHIGDHLVLGSIVGRDLTKSPGLHRTLIGDGVATFCAGFIGGPANTTYGENTGVIGLTKVASVWVIGGAAVTAFCLGFIGKFTALVQTIPGAVMGGVSILLFGVIASSGVRVLINNQIDFGRQRNLIIGAVILIVGIGGLTINIGKITLSGMALAAIIGVILHLILPDKEASYGQRSSKTELEVTDEDLVNQFTKTTKNEKVTSI
ncbi:solute carrier family 23 protein [Turicibacter sp. TS3]|uniref:solute carrier family 23 protein n=1 Tax=Turicibacter sp. TS3 TaxID=2304578 RepID=UPI00137AE1F4|nr:solute carrier family 23 protein [Turicibacter sp. TS3]NCE78796.1 uracil permease [Turicibacter sp. TS3]